ncbi:oxidoreductase [Wolfiporia cocos MD-104 SS10]|uniref:Oxidoreductase n=1 Tax=Wolfiporia cocos (strain MD-104) TaxID=742152 RepID=A0A2H3J5M8_WOLCO|nr:oxidoreductase [Wolfiporia cocos MD-104 SS10]
MSRVVIVTGCSEGGIGYSLCLEFASRGCKVYATARRPESMDSLTHKNIERLKLDVTDDANVADVVKTVVEREGRIDILFNNAGVECTGPLAEMPLDRIAQSFDANVFSVIRMVRAVFPHMAARKSGTIVNMGSIAGEIATPWGGVYSATKACLKSISETLYMECAPFNISVVHLTPGGVKSNIATNYLNKFSCLPQPDSFYGGYLDSMVQHIGLSRSPHAMPSEEFARRVVTAVLQKNPPRYMTLASASTIFQILQWLPRGFVLWLFWKLLVGKPAHD